MLHQRHQEWLEARGIQSATAEKMEVSTVSDQSGNWLCFPYRLDGVLVNRKYRLTSEKQHRMDKGGRLCLWNADALRLQHVVEHGASLVITEGEFDAMPRSSAGSRRRSQSPTAAPAERIDDPMESNRYRFLWESQDDLERVKSFILATDSDGPGLLLAHDLAARFSAPSGASSSNTPRAARI
jgi:twinkle protein